MSDTASGNAGSQIRMVDGHPAHQSGFVISDVGLQRLQADPNKANPPAASVDLADGADQF